MVRVYNAIMPSFRDQIKKYNFYLTLPDFARTSSVIEDIKNDIHTLSDQERDYLEFMELKITSYLQCYNGDKILNELKELNNRICESKQQSKISFEILWSIADLTSQLFDDTKKNDIMMQLRDKLSVASEFSAIERDILDTELKMIELRSGIFNGDAKEREIAFEELKELTAYCFKNCYYNLIYQELGRLNTFHCPKSILRSYADFLKEHASSLENEIRARLLLHIGMLYNQYVGYFSDEKENKIWIDVLEESKSIYNEMGQKAEFYLFQVNYELGRNIGWHKLSDYTNSVQFLLDIISQGEKWNARYEVGKASIYLGEEYAEQGKHERSERYLKKGLELLERYQEKNSWYYELLSKVQGELGKSDMEIANLKETIIQDMTPPFWFYCGNEKSMLDASITSKVSRLVKKYTERGAMNEGIEFMEELISKEYHTDFTTVKSRVILELSDLLIQKGKLEKAIDYVKDSIQASRNIGYTVQLVRSLNQAAFIYYEKNLKEQALEYWKDAFLRFQFWLINTAGYTDIFDFMDLFEKPKFSLDIDFMYHQYIINILQIEERPEQYIHSLANLAVINQIKANWNVALALWDEIYSLSDEFKVPNLMVISLIKQGEIGLINGDFDKYESYYRKAGVALKEVINDLPDYGWMYQSSLFIYAPIGKLTLVPKDNPKYEEPENKGEDEIANSFFGRNYLSEAMVWLKKFDFKKAEERLKQSITLDSKDYRVYTYYLLARMKIRENNVTSAKKYMDETFKLIDDKYIFGNEEWHVDRRDGFIKDINRLETRLSIVTNLLETA